jgi:hypothetical protein
MRVVPRLRSRGERTSLYLLECEGREDLVHSFYEHLSRARGRLFQQCFVLESGEGEVDSSPSGVGCGVCGLRNHKMPTPTNMKRIEMMAVTIIPQPFPRNSIAGCAPAIIRMMFPAIDTKPNSRSANRPKAPATTNRTLHFDLCAADSNRRKTRSTSTPPFYQRRRSVIRQV